MQQILKINDLIEGLVVKRPSKFIKSPYVSDVLLKDNDETQLTHSPSLGCCGLADKDANVLVAKMPDKKQKQKSIKNEEQNEQKEKLSCQYVIYLSIHKEKNTEQIIGIHPKLAEQLAEKALQQNLLSKLSNVKQYKKEAVLYVEDKVDSRFDFMGMDENNIPFIMEVKNVPLADYEDISSKERCKMDFQDRSVDSKVAYFPDGYRKKQTDTVSPRALKHIKELTIIKKESKTRCIMCYVIQRTDINRFQPSVIDPEYRSAFYDAVKNGVEIITMVVMWNRNGEAYFVRDDLPIIFE